MFNLIFIIMIFKKFKKYSKRFNNAVNNLKNKKVLFFVDNYNYEIVIMKEKESFLDFYLTIFREYICRYMFDECLNNSSTNFYLYIPQFYKENYNSLEWDIFINHLGKNYNSYENEMMNEILVFY